ncbi:MAG: ABC transporter ATP-binding protein [bacterium]|nr:ABC transporter ATP-binding protein [bacterium]
MLHIQHLTKKFGKLVAVDDLSLSIDAGEIYAYIGPNGSGKTTTIKMIAGLYLPTSGTIAVGGTDLGAEPERAKKHMGYIPDEPFIYDKMSGREFLGFVAALYGMDRVEGARQSEGYLENFGGLAEVIDGFVEDYSRGNKQKLAFVAALMHRPRLLLIDEPMVGLDPQSALAVKKILKEFTGSGGTALLCTHTLSIAQELANRIGILQKGKLIAEGTLEALRAKAGKPGASLEEVYLALTDSDD